MTEPAPPVRPRGWRDRRVRIVVHLLALFATPFTCYAAFATRPWWSALFRSTVPRSDSSGLSDAFLLLGALVVGVAVSAFAWFALGRPRAHAVALLVAALAGPSVVLVDLVGEARTYSGAALAAQAREVKAAEQKQQDAAATQDAGLRTWVAALRPGAQPYLGAPADGNGLTWRGRTYHLANGMRAPRGAPLFVVAGDERHLLVQWFESDNVTQKSSLLDLVPVPVPTATATATVAGARAALPRTIDYGYLGGVAVDPAGTRFAYAVSSFPGDAGYAGSSPSTKVVVRALPGGAVVATLAVPFAAGVVGWGTGGLTAMPASTGEAVGLLVSPDAKGAFRPVDASGQGATGEVQVAAHGVRVLAAACPAPFFQSADGGFADLRWPQSYPLSSSQCLTQSADHRVWTPGTATTTWKGTDAVGISPDGRYLVRGDLEVVDLDAARTTPLAPALQPALSRDPALNPIAVGFWHDDRSVEVTVSGTPVAVCTLPSGPCVGTGRTPW